MNECNRVPLSDSVIACGGRCRREGRGRGKTKKDVLDQIHSRAGDSESYIQTQLKFADMIIEPILLEESKDYGYKIIFPNSFPMDEIYEKLSKAS